jgi:hypothetical protein
MSSKYSWLGLSGTPTVAEDGALLLPNLYWECGIHLGGTKQGEKKTLQGLVIPTEEPYISIETSRKLRIDWRLFDRSGDIESGFDIYTQWLKCVAAYSSRELTFEKDKILAISGLAAAVAKGIPQKRCLAGIWD